MIVQPFKDVARRSLERYARGMETITQRELRNNSAAIMDAVERGESFRVSRHGVEVAELRPVAARAFVPVAEVKRAFARLPTGDYAAMRAEADAFFGPDLVDD